MRENELAAREGGGIAVRLGAVRANWELNDVQSSDGHEVRIGFAVSVQLLGDANNRRMLDESLLAGRASLTLAELVAYFQAGLLQTAQETAAKFSAENLLTETAKAQVRTALFEGANSLAFSCGVEFMQPASVQIDCPTLRRQQSVRRVQQDQQEAFRRSADVLAEFSKLRAACPELSAAQVLMQMGGADSAALLKPLLLAEAGKTAQLCIAAGPSLLRIVVDAAAGNAATKNTIQLPTTLGPSRSVQRGNNGELLVGCRQGVVAMADSESGEPVCFVDAILASALGFNGAIAIGEEIWAAHGEGGLVVWNRNQPAEPVRAVRGSDGPVAGFSPRNLTALPGGHVLLSSGGELLASGTDGGLRVVRGNQNGGENWQSQAEIAAILNCGQQVMVARVDGAVAVLDVRDLRVESQRRYGSITAAAALPWLGESRLLLATAEGPVLCVRPEDDLVLQFSSNQRGLRIVAGAVGIVAAISADRQRLLIWRAWEGREPAIDLHVFGTTRHRAADLAAI